MVSEGKGALYKRVDGKYLVYIPKNLGDDSMFPFKTLMKPSAKGRGFSIPVEVSFTDDPSTIPKGVSILIIKPMKASPSPK